MTSGQRVRIAIARALLQDRPILLLDNIVTGIDTRTYRLERNHGYFGFTSWQNLEY